MTNIKLSIYLFVFSIVTLTMNSISAQDMNLVTRLVEMGQYNHAKAILVPAAQSSNDTYLLYTLAKIYQDQGIIDSANLYYTKITTVAVGTPMALICQNIVDFNNKKVPDVSNYNRAQKLAGSSKDLYALTQLAEVRYMTGDTSNWKQSLEMATKIDKKYIQAYIIAGGIYTKIAEKTLFGEDYGKASGRYEQALYYSPNNSEARTKLSYIFLLARNYGGAEQELLKVLEVDTAYIPALKSMGELEYTIGKYSQASYYFGKYMAIAETTPKDLSKYINILYFNKEYAKSNELIDKSLIIDPENAVLLRLQGYTSFELKKSSKGLDAMSKFFSLRKDIGNDKIIFSDYEYYGKLLSKEGKDSLAIVNLQNALAMDSTKTYLYEDIAKAYEKMKDYIHAEESYEKLISKTSNVSAMIYFNMGLDYNYIATDSAVASDTTKFKEYITLADSCFSTVSKLSPNSHLGYIYRARMQSKLDPESELGLAKVHYENALTVIEAKNDTVKFKNEILEIYRYLGYYHYLQYLNEKAAKNADGVKYNKDMSILYWQKILAYEPTDKIALEAVKVFK